jgi:hypothetical protein
MSTLKLVNLQHQSSNTPALVLNANNLVSVTGNLNVSNNLVVTGNTIHTGTTTFIGNVTAGNLTVSGATIHTGPTTFTGNVTAGNLTVSGATIHTGPTTFTGNVSGNLVVTGTITDNLGGLRILPTVSQSTYYSLTANDIGKVISFATGNVAIPNAVFTTGDNITIYNNSAASINVISNTSVTSYLVGTATTGTRVLAQRGLATVLCVAANTFVVTGGGLT